MDPKTALQIVDEAVAASLPTAEAEPETPPVETPPAEIPPKGEIPPAEKKTEVPVEIEPTDAEIEEHVDLVSGSVDKLKLIVGETPELSKILKENPSLRSTLYYNARIADKVKAYDGLFTNVDEAQRVVTDAAKFTEMNDALTGDPGKALEFLAMSSVEKDEKGEPLRDKNGMVITDGRYGSLMAEYRNQGLYPSALNHAAKLRAAGNENDADELEAAVAALQRIVEGIPIEDGKPKAGAKPPAVAKDDDDLSYLSPKHREIIRAAQGKEAPETFVARATEAIDKDITDTVNGLIEKATKGRDVVFTDYQKKHITRDAVEALTEALKKTQTYDVRLKGLLKTVPKNDAGLKQILEYNQSVVKNLAVRAVQGAIAPVTKAVISDAVLKDKKIEKQLSDREAPGAGGVSVPTRPEFNAVVAAKQKEKGKSLTAEELVGLSIETSLAMAGKR